ncbi:MAG: thymidylate synthase (FAD) [Rickettsiales bacterium]|nr:thymidylate synthase (FAD) [Rickettsiales bacterium]|tara:strand:- start:124 stop:1068 length:945 start_codon:yes stop_codon:yes gene_type:complete
MALTAEQQQELSTNKAELQQTYRPIAPELEAILGDPLPVLDHGFVRVVDYMGDDAAIVQAARVSYGKGTKKVNQDKGLINYLMRHWHTTPFEMCEIKFHIKLPMFVARQWIRHRTANVNEYSARYSILDKEFYIPQPELITPQSQQNNQGRSNERLKPEEEARVLDILKADAMQTYDHYEELMNCDAQGNVLNEERDGIARELARMNLTMNYYTQWYWKIDLHNLMHFLMLRADSHAQYEIRAYADVMIDVLKKWCPLAHDAFEEYRMHSAHVSRSGLDVVKRMLSGEEVTVENSGLTKREWNELMVKLDRPTV